MMANRARYKCVLLFGAPGVGKGTQGRKIGEMGGFVHLATGDIFRSLDSDSPLGRQFVKYSSRGELVPDDLTVELWQDHVQGLIAAGAYDPARDILLLDGMPRSTNQARMLDGLIEPLAIVHLVAPDMDQMVQRMKKRAETEGRHDDADESVIRNRFDVYERETRPVLDHYPAKIMHDVDATGTIEQVFQRVRKVVDVLQD